MLKKLILGATLIVGSLSTANAAVSAPLICDIFTKDQVTALQYAHDKGKQHDLQWTLAAIAWQESSAGQVLKHPKAHSYGVFGNWLPTVEARLKDKEFAESLGKVPLNRSQTIFLLQNDWEFSADLALVELNYWKQRHNGNHHKTISSYFGGNKPNTPAAKSYAKRLEGKIRYLKQTGCIHG